MAKLENLKNFNGKTRWQNLTIWIEKTGGEFENYKNLMKQFGGEIGKFEHLMGKLGHKIGKYEYRESRWRIWKFEKFKKKLMEE